MQDESPPPQPEYLAALDLGSNSFHLAIARVVGSRIQIIDRLQDRVQLAAGLDAERRLDTETENRALAVLERFGQRLRDFPGASVRAVGTDTLRVATNAASFIERGSAILGHPIEVVPGEEEARLIYAGVAHGNPHEDGARQLVIDIGGGSTECIIGVGLQPEQLQSLHVGCVNFTTRFFPDRIVTRDRFRRAQIAAQLAFERLPPAYFTGDWQRAFGASGTFLALEEILRANQFAADGITRDGLTRLRDVLIAQGHADRFAIPGLKPSRAGVIAAGLAIARAAFRTLPLRQLQTTTYALREGVLFELLRRFAAGDILESTVARVAQRFGVDETQGRRVAQTALGLFDQVQNWVGSQPGDITIARRFLGWAARLHELGMVIAFHGYHKHGAYIVENTPLPGFSQDDSRFLATLILTHRRKLTRDQFNPVPRHLRELALRTALILRIAVRIHRMRGEVPAEGVALSVQNRTLHVRFPHGFLETHPLTVADFEEETQRLQGAGFHLQIS
jgi:exopolyphosphatase/guanosine-5'-triphosphate,3'-diphosphate pyrophosphatase